MRSLGSAPAFLPTLAVATFVFLFPSALRADVAIKRLTSNTWADQFPCINGAGEIAWRGRQGQVITNRRVIPDVAPGVRAVGSFCDINASGHIVWEQKDILEIGSSELGLIPGPNNPTNPGDYKPKLDDAGNIFWKAQPLDWLYYVIYWRDAATGAVSELVEDRLIGGGRWPVPNDAGIVVWQGLTGVPPSYDIWAYDFATGAATNLSQRPGSDMAPHVNDDGLVVWTGYDGHDWEIYAWQDGVVWQITDNDFDDGEDGVTANLERSPDVNDLGDVVWSGNAGAGWNVFLFSQGAITQITNTVAAANEAKINDRRAIVWQEGTGTPSEIYVAYVSDGPACGDGVDNDGDGLADFPADPGCASPGSALEDPTCLDGFDNDGDGLADHPLDAGCASAFDATEAADCSNGLDDDGDGWIDFPTDPGCASAADGSEQSSLLVCDNGSDDDADDLTDFPADPGCSSSLDDSEDSAPAACSNGLDDDGDGLADFPADPGCDGADDASEQAITLVCDDGVDNDGDSLTDFPADPECGDPTDTSEAPACLDGADNDTDGLADFPADPGCVDASDDSEHAASLACDNGLDDDGDGAADFPGDLGCVGPLTARENPRCQDGIDNDGDGRIDFDGGASAAPGIPPVLPDAECAGISTRDRENAASSCGLGAELTALLLAIRAGRQRARKLVRARHGRAERSG